MNFKEFMLALEGGFIADEKAEDGKSKIKNPAVRGPSSVTTSGVSGGGPAGYKGGGGGMGAGAAPAPAPAMAPPKK